MPCILTSECTPENRGNGKWNMELLKMYFALILSVPLHYYSNRIEEHMILNSRWVMFKTTLTRTTLRILIMENSINFTYLPRHLGAMLVPMLISVPFCKNEQKKTLGGSYLKASGITMRPLLFSKVDLFPQQIQEYNPYLNVHGT